MRPWTVITVCHQRDLGVLRLQARSLAQRLAPGLADRVLVIENDSDTEAFVARFEHEVLPEYGALRPQVELIRRDEIAPGIGFAHGWRSQQILKMLAARRVRTELMLILDAKNHFIRPVTAASYQAEDGRLRSCAVSQRGHLEHMFRNSYAALGLDPAAFIDRALPNITPFPARTATIRAMIDALERRHGQSLAEVLLFNDVAEFYLLQAFIAGRDGGFEREYVFGAADVVTVFPDKAEAGAFLSVDHQLTQDSVLCFGVHWAAIGLLSAPVRTRIAAIWLAHGLVADQAEGEALLGVTPGLDQMPMNRSD